MPTKLLFISIIALGLFSFSKKNKDTTIAIESKAWAKSWGKVKDGIWMQKTEVSNAEFRLFLNDLKNKGRLEEWKAFYPDTTGWAKGNRGTKPYVEYYFSNPSFNNYPVVNITYEAATAYCEWLSKQYGGSEKQPFGKVIFRLPTHEEWKKAASSGKEDGRQFPWNGLYLHNNRRERLCNFRPDSISTTQVDAGGKKKKVLHPVPENFAVVTAPVNSFFPNDIGLYNVCGNVAEMLSEKGVAAGGSFEDFGYNVRIQSTKEFSGVTRDIGFRVLMQSAAQL